MLVKEIKEGETNGIYMLLANVAVRSIAVRLDVFLEEGDACVNMNSIRQKDLLDCNCL